MGRPRIYANDAERQRAFRARRRSVQRQVRASAGIASSAATPFVPAPETELEKRERLVAELLAKYPPVQRLEEIMGPEPTPDEADEVDAFLQLRNQWRQPYRKWEGETP
jgi:hypothetical protein